MKRNYDECVTKYSDSFVRVVLDPGYVSRIQNFVTELVEAKSKEDHHKIDSNKEVKRFTTGFLGEAALEKLFGIPIIDWTIGYSGLYHIPDIPGYRVGIKTVERDKFPIIFKDNSYPQIICIKSTKYNNLIFVCGLATSNVLNKRNRRYFTMKKNFTELVFILDKSGSMSGLENDTIGGFNSMLEKQKAVDGECRITTVLFDNSYTLLHDRIDIHAVSPMTNTEYFVGGSTALLDAIGLTINKLVSVQRNTAEDYRADKVMFVIITDGEENSSREYSADKVRSMIEHEKEKYGWEFIFLGANIDAVQTAQRFGIDADRAVDYIPDAKGTQLNFEAMAETVACYRMTGAVPAEPMEEIRKDMKKRGGRK